MSLWKDCRHWSSVKLELRETVKLCICAWMSVSLCAVFENDEGLGGLGGVTVFWASFLLSWWFCFCHCWPLPVKHWKCCLAVVWDHMLSGFMSDFRVFLVPQDCKDLRVPQEIRVRGWVNTKPWFTTYSRCEPCLTLSPHHKCLNMTFIFC